MSRTRGPGNLVARRPMTVARIDADAHQEYASMIEQDLGGRRPSYRAIDDGLPPSTVSLMMRPLALFLLACTALIVVATAWLYQAGLFGNLKLSAHAPAPAPSASWMGARQPAMPRTIAEAPKPKVPAAKLPEPRPEPAPPSEEQEPEANEGADGGTNE